MLHSVRSLRGMVTSPHHLASQAGLGVLQDGGNAVEAAVAVAACLAVVYPHMTGIGGDGFWLIAEPGKSPVGIDACGEQQPHIVRMALLDGVFPGDAPPSFKRVTMRVPRGSSVSSSSAVMRDMKPRTSGRWRASAV